MRILIAEDDLSSRNMLSTVLKIRGHQVIATATGEEAWQVMQQPDAPELAILDWLMPGLDGLEVVRLVRAQLIGWSPYLIILTARNKKADIVTGLEAGADDYLTKPFDPGELIARIAVGQRILELQARMRQSLARVQRSEARNRAMLNAIPDLMFRLNQDGRILDYNAHAGDDLYLPPEQFMGRPVAHLLPPQAARQTESHLARLFETGEMQLFEYSLAMFNGQHTYEARLVLIDPQEVLAIVRDITQAVCLTQMKTDFINRASHELRTPLTTAILMADLIHEGGKDADLAEYWQILQAELQRQRRLVEDLLTMDQLENHILRIAVHPVTLFPILKSCLRSLEPALKGKHHSLDVSIPPDLPQVQADENGLARVFTNLLHNAVKYTPNHGQIKVSVKVDSSRQVAVAISDTGIGIPPADLPHLFRRFFRATNATRQEIPGSGVGLYLAKSILQEIGGQINVTSTLGQGTTFTVTLRPAF